MIKDVKRPPNLKIPSLTPVEISRFWSKIKQNTETECWLWLCGGGPDGRGRFWLRGKTYKAPRIAYYITTGIDPQKCMVCHKCNNPICCNPKHLYLGNAKTNSLDCLFFGERVCGERQGLSKLTEVDVKLIRKLYIQTPLSQRALAKQFNVAQNTIKQVIKYQTWKHI